jgi:CRP-like cAMP-binding protein
MTVEIEKLKTIKYFAGLEDRDLQCVMTKITETRFEKGETIEFEGEDSEFLYFVINGIIKVFKTSFNGKDQILHFASSGDPLNDVSTFDSGPNAATMLALTPVSVYAITKTDLKEIILNSPAVCLNIIESLAIRARRDASLIQELHDGHVSIRLAKLLLGSYAGQKETVAMQLTQNDMACILGTCREIVNRSLKSMEKKGAIKLVGYKVLVIDRKILSELTRETSESPAC